MQIPHKIESWAADLIADPVSKLHRNFESFVSTKGIPDARVFLPNTSGFYDWQHGQTEFEAWERNSEAYNNEVQKYLDEISWDQEIYLQLALKDPILDVGGHIGTIREFLPRDAKLLSVDPYLEGPLEVPDSKYQAYSSLKQPLNFIAGMAEFLPIVSGSIKTVHMRSMLDHVQVPDLALIEAHRVLQDDGQLIVGMSIEGAPYGLKYTKSQNFKMRIAMSLGRFGVKRFAVPHDHHTWHPTLVNLRNLIEGNGFQIETQLWQKKWQGRVVFLTARKNHKLQGG